MSLFRPLLMLRNKAASSGNFSSHLLRRNNHACLMTKKHPSQSPWKIQRRSLMEAAAGGFEAGKVSDIVYLYPFLRSTAALWAYTLMFSGGLGWKLMGVGGALPSFHPIGDYKLASLFGKDSYFLSMLSSVLEALKMVARAIYLSILFTPVIAMPLFANYFGSQYRKTWLHFVYVALEKAGPAFIKWGQWASTRRDLFPADLCNELSKLLTITALEHSFDYTKQTVEKAFGRNLLDIFVDFEEAPVGSGHLTQVHRATLRCDNPGKEKKNHVVAVKIRHPGVSESLERDLSIVRFFAKILRSIFPNTKFKWSRFDETLQQFAVFMESQVDLSRKAVLMSHFYHRFDICKGLASPEPLYPLVHPDVLVETFEEGESLARYIQGNSNLEPSFKDRDTIVGDGTRVLLKMFAGNKFLGADISPRNILFRVDKEWPRFIILDVGMTSIFPRSYFRTVVDVIQAVGKRDGRSAAEGTLKLSMKQECPCPHAFIEDVKESFTTWDSTKELACPSEFLQRLFEKAQNYDVNIDDSAFSVMELFLVLEGWQQIVCIQSMNRAIPIMQSMYSREPIYRGVTENRNERGQREQTETCSPNPHSLKHKLSPSPSSSSSRKQKSFKENAPPPSSDFNTLHDIGKPPLSGGKISKSPLLPPRPPSSNNNNNNPLKRKLNMGTVLEHSVAGSSDSGVKVIVRMRPLNKNEEEGEMIVQKVSSDSLSILNQTFTFDSVADADSSQQEIFQLVGVPLVENCLAGFNSSIFAYGQDEVKHIDKQLKYQCRCSFLEIYNEQITDLLDPTQRNLLIREDVKSGVYVENLTEEIVCTMEDVTQILIKCASDGLSSMRISRINLVDLAGSERQKLTGAAGERLKEAGNINRSLSQLGYNFFSIVFCFITKL
ncbi:hypothetical protein IFM89_002889 [Coptis chinensis]|uniref:Kinesin-like protein n=1 Tax=Coptis chinensis TaxID=261450 RepID=A0A835M9M2_9MAGN|nr:hypothetical protein IFM89_002889 [Coptis chinensis]